MKIHFESTLDYQMHAIEAVCGLFKGQEICQTEFTVASSGSNGNLNLGIEESEIGVGNRLSLPQSAILKNLNDTQIKNGLPISIDLSSNDFTVEMETGTGKTYVYLRTIFELNKRYGFTKFVVVVPSVAIKEGVYKTLEITQDHFKGLYSGVPFEYFLYDSSRLGQVRSFATNPNIEIMVITVGAINKKDVNNLYKDSEKTGGDKPIELIRSTRPIIIVDEPQSVDGGLDGRGKEALDAMNPLCTLRYSATHINKFNMVYRLDAVDAYDKKLVKQIEVASATVENAHNKPFIKLLSVQNKKGSVSAKIELDIKTSGGVVRKCLTVMDGDNLEEVASRSLYKDFYVGEIFTGKGEEYLELRLPGEEKFLALGDSHGDVDSMVVQREMIRRTIKEHLDKELRLVPLDIKVLSLFFIDSVDKYRKYDPHGGILKGEYAKIFEEELHRAAKLPKYKQLFTDKDLDLLVQESHGGYFSIDKKGAWVDTAETNAAGRDGAERAYNLIMREKEKLLSLQTPLKFIFSHSALKEGWDNPNVFQICSLREMHSERERRQTIGRGLRLCVKAVDNDYVRVHGFDINTLTVIAAESYEEFAENLQKEIERDAGIYFGVLEPHQFSSIPDMANPDGSKLLGIAQSKEIWESLRQSNYINEKGKIEDKLKSALMESALELPSKFEIYRNNITNILVRISGKVAIKNADEKRVIPLRKSIFLGSEFQSLWDRIKYKTTYHVQFSTEQLISDCVSSLKTAPPISRSILQWRKADIKIARSGVEADEASGSATIVINEGSIDLPDILSDLQDRTKLTRKTLVKILLGCGRLEEFRLNPQQFIEISSVCINRCKRLLLVDGIKYERIGNNFYYAQELFSKEELVGYLKNTLSDTEKSVYESVVYDSEVEKAFALSMESNEAIKLYAKLPAWFKIQTPLGSYNPDWAVYVDIEGTQKLYFVIETKSSLYSDDLRDKERARIACGKAHFKALADIDSPAHYLVAESLTDVLNKADKLIN